MFCNYISFTCNVKAECCLFLCVVSKCEALPRLVSSVPPDTSNTLNALLFYIPAVLEQNVSSCLRYVFIAVGCLTSGVTFD